MFVYKTLKNGFGRTRFCRQRPRESAPRPFIGGTSIGIRHNAFAQFESSAGTPSPSLQHARSSQLCSFGSKTVRADRAAAERRGQGLQLCLTSSRGLLRLGIWHPRLRQLERSPRRDINSGLENQKKVRNCT